MKSCEKGVLVYYYPSDIMQIQSGRIYIFYRHSMSCIIEPCPTRKRKYLKCYKFNFIKARPPKKGGPLKCGIVQKYHSATTNWLSWMMTFAQQVRGTFYFPGICHFQTQWTVQSKHRSTIDRSFCHCNCSSFNRPPCLIHGSMYWRKGRGQIWREFRRCVKKGLYLMLWRAETDLTPLPQHILLSFCSSAICESDTSMVLVTSKQDDPFLKSST